MSEQISPKQPGRRPNSVLYIFLIIPLLSVVAAVLTVTAAPNFELPDLDGNLERLSSYRGRVVFVNFWATWCEPCKREMPAFQQFMQSQPEGGPIILAVNASEPVELIQSFLDDYNVTDLPVLLDAEYQAQDAYNTEFYPITFVVDKGGIIQDQIRGELTLDDLNAYVARYE